MKLTDSFEGRVSGMRTKPVVLAASLLAISAMAACSNSNDPSPFEQGPDIQPPAGQFTAVYAVRGGNELVTFDAATPATVTSIGTVTGLGTEESIVGLDFRPADGNLHAVTTSGDMLIIDPATAIGTPIQSIVGDGTALVADRYGVDFNPAANALRVIGSDGLNLRVPTTALVAPAPATPVNTLVDGRMGVVQGVTAAAYTNPFQGEGNSGTDLFVIDASGQFYRQDANGGSLTPIGDGLVEGVTAASAYAIAQVGSENEHYALLTVGSSVGLYTIDPVAGTAELIDELEAGDYFVLVVDDEVDGADNRFVGVLRQTGSGPELLGFALDTETGTLTLEETLPVTGLNEGDVLVGLDDRGTAPVDVFDGGYAVGSSGQIYTIEDNNEDNPTALVATPVAQLSVALDGEVFGVDFNPVADLLRIVSDTGQNLRVNLDEGRSIACRDGMAAEREPGFACVDGRTRLGGENVQIVATAYRGENPGNGDFQYAINAQDASLYRVSVPNDGALVAVGELGVTLSDAEQSFDIISNGDVEGGVLALSEAGAAVSTLYGLNLETGAATAIGAIGDDGAVSALTVRFEDIPTPTPSPSVSPTADPSPTAEPSPTADPSPSVSPTATPVVVIEASEAL